MQTILSTITFLATLLFFISSLSAQPEEIEQKVERTLNGEVIHRIVNQMPRFPGCEKSDKPKALKNACAKDKLIQFISSKLRYPTDAAKEGIEGMVLVSFVVDENGVIQAPEVVRDIGGGCGEEALRVVTLMPKWIPGMHEEKAVKVRFNLPLHFKFQEKSEEADNETEQYTLIWSDARPEGVQKSDLEKLSTEKIYVRDLYGKMHPVSELELEYERGLSYKRVSGDDQISEKMAKVIRKAGKRGRIIFSAIIQGQDDFLTIRQEFIVK